MALTGSTLLPLSTPLPDFSLTDPATLQQVDKSILPATAEGVLVAVILQSLSLRAAPASAVG